MPVDELDDCMLAGHIGVLNRQITRLFTPPDDVAFLIDGERLALIADRQSPRPDPDWL